MSGEGKTAKDCSQQTQSLLVSVGNIRTQVQTPEHTGLHREPTDTHLLWNSEEKGWGESPGNEFISSLEEGMGKRRSWRWRGHGAGSKSQISKCDPGVGRKGGGRGGRGQVQSAYGSHGKRGRCRAEDSAHSYKHCGVLPWGWGAYEEMQDD